MIYVVSVLKKNSEFSVNKCQNSMAKKPWWFEILPTILKFAIIVKKFAGDNFSNFMELFYFRYFFLWKNTKAFSLLKLSWGEQMKKSTKFNFSRQNHSLECFSKLHEKVSNTDFPSKVLNCRFFHLIHSRKTPQKYF